MKTLVTMTALGCCALLATGCAHLDTTAGTMPPVMTYTCPVTAYQPVYQPVYTPQPVVHFYGSGIGAIQAGLMNNLGRR